jgi:DNA-binding CsgD family transcriptional regulator
MIKSATGGSPAPAVTGTLLEREAELRAFEDALGNSQAGRGGIMLVEAATGLGKSRLLGEAATIAGSQGMRVLAASGRDLERDLPFGVALQLFEKVVSRLDDAERKRVLSGSAGLATPIVVEGAPPPAGLGAALHGLYWLTANLAQERPLVLCIDDVHWCDPPTLRFLVYLAQRIEELRVAAVLAVAAGHPPDPDHLLEELRAHQAARVLRPQPLSAEAVAKRLRDSVLPEIEPDFALACHQATGGNPLLLGELGVELAMREVEPEDGNAYVVHELAPESLSAVVVVRLRRLGKGAPALTRAVAVLGDGAELRHVAALAELPVERTLELADSLMGAGVLRREPRFSFVHSVVRLAIYAERPEFERAEAHRRAAGILMAEQAPVERVVPHLLAGRPAGDPRAVEILLQAGERALAGGAPDSAMRLLRRALEEPPSHERRADVLVALGRAEGAAGAPEATERLTGALDLIGEPSGRAAAALDAGRMLISQARWGDAAETLGRGFEDVDRSDEGLRAQLEAAYAAATRLAPGDEMQGRPVALDDETLERTAAGRVRLAQAAADRALSGTSAAEVRRLAARALGGGALLEDETSDGVAFYLAVWALAVAEDLQTAELAATTAVDDARRRGSVLGFATACHFRSLGVLRRGRIADAAADAVNALAARRYGWRFALASAVAVRAECHVEEGDLQAAARELQGLRQRNEPPRDPDAYRFVGVRGHVRLLEFSPAAALQDLLEAGRLLHQLGGRNSAIYPWRTLASAALLALGDRAEARRLAEEELAMAAAFGAPGAHGRALGAIAATAERSEAIEAREEAVRVLESGQTALDRARALVDLGTALRRATRRRDAREPLRLGLDLALRCGARALALRAREELAAVGARPRRDAVTGRDALTARETQVAGLAAEDMSNREIAEALFVTIKTVEWHLKHAYAKLGVRSRRELRSALATRSGYLDFQSLVPSGRKKSVSLRLDRLGHDALREHLDGPGRSEVAVLHTAVRYYLGDAGSGRIAWRVPRLARSAALADTLEVELDEDLHAELRLEARRQQVAPDLLATHAILYYLIDLDSGQAGRLLGDAMSRDGQLRPVRSKGSTSNPSAR